MTKTMTTKVVSSVLFTLILSSATGVFNKAFAGKVDQYGFPSTYNPVTEVVDLEVWCKGTDMEVAVPVGTVISIVCEEEEVEW